MQSKWFGRRQVKLVYRDTTKNATVRLKIEHVFNNCSHIGSHRSLQPAFVARSHGVVDMALHSHPLGYPLRDLPGTDERGSIVTASGHVGARIATALGVSKSYLYSLVKAQPAGSTENA